MWTADNESAARALRVRIRSLQSLFPDTAFAMRDGLLCAGGELSMDLLLAAYGLGVFPWYNEGEPVLWWSPAPRCVLPLDAYHLPRRAARAIRRAGFALTLDRAFPAVISLCARLRAAHEGTWITRAVERSFNELHQAGFAHSVEAWRSGRLVGGLYGVAIGRAFFGESMFHLESEASRACLAALVDLLRLRGATLLDCQQETPHIMAQGGVTIPRRAFQEALARAQALDCASPDALTREYAAEPGILRALWPFLPWRSRYRREADAWIPVPMDDMEGVPGM